MAQLFKVSLFRPTSRQCSIPQAYSLQVCDAAEGMDGLMGTNHRPQGVLVVVVGEVPQPGPLFEMTIINISPAKAR